MSFTLEGNFNDAPPVTLGLEIENSNIYYNCTECSSLIKILSINEDTNIIEFKCLNKENNHGKKKMLIKEYLSKMERFRINNINENKCKEHSLNTSNKFVNYCHDCNRHLCEECLKSRAHINHNKTNLIEIKPREEELLIIEEILKDYNIKIDNLRKEKVNKENELDDILINMKEYENNRINENLRNNNIKKEEELKECKKDFILEIEEIKKRYEKEIKEKIEKYKKKNNEINNKYKLNNKKEYKIHEFKMKELDREYKEKIKNLKYDIKIENMFNIIKLTEIVYNTYNVHNNNYFNSYNIKNLLLSFYNNDYIKNELIKRILSNENYEETIEIIEKEKDEDKEKEKEKEKIKEEYKEIIEEEKEKIIEEYKKKIKDLEMKLNNKKEMDKIKNENKKEKRFQKDDDISNNYI